MMQWLDRGILRALAQRQFNGHISDIKIPFFNNCPSMQSDFGWKLQEENLICILFWLTTSSYSSVFCTVLFLGQGTGD